MKRILNRVLIVMLFCSVFCTNIGLYASGLDTGSVSKIAAENFLGTHNHNKYDMTFRDAPLRDVLQFLSLIAGVNIVVPEGIEAVVNVTFKDIFISDALNAIIRSNKLEYTIEGKVIRVGRLAQFREAGEDLKTETFRLRYAQATDILDNVKALISSRGSAVADGRTNSLIVRDVVSNMGNIHRFIGDVDIKDAQVLIESKILEATRSFSRSLGIQWGVNRGSDGWNWRIGGTQATGQADSGRNFNVNLPADSPTSGLLVGAFLKRTNLDFQLSAAEQRGDAYVISDPSIVTSNGKSAKIRSGSTMVLQGTGTVNIGTDGGTTTSTGASDYDQIETGIQLSVTPQITIDDYVKMSIEAETSSPDFSRMIQGVPVIVDNTASTTVVVKNGETTVIGGLTRFSDSLSKKRVPGFSRIPLIGNLFKSKSKSLDNTELLIFIKPTIIRVAGVQPAQIRVHEVERRRDSMYLKPILDPKKDKEKKMRKIKRISLRKGNKYIR